ncbi:MAG: NFACT family protein [candidate division Zixibacteria bacterium]
MEAQKPTVLDIARLASEIGRFAGAKIIKSITDDSRSRFYMKLARPDIILKFAVEKKFAFMGQTSVLPEEVDDIFPAIDGYIVSGCSQVNSDRILRIDLEKKDRLGRTKSLGLIFEIIPNKGNVYLIGTDDSLKGNLKNRHIRNYKPPAPFKKMSVLDFDDAKLAALIESGANPAKEIMGLNNRDLLNIGTEIKKDPESAGPILSNYVNKATEPGPAWMIMDGDAPIGFSLIEPSLSEGEIEVVFDSALQMYESYYSVGAIDDQADSGSATLLKILDSHIVKAGKKLAAIENDLVEAGKAEKYKTYGELILANLGAIEKGQKSVRLKSMTAGSTESHEIELDPSKSPSVNAAGYFKKYKKAASGLKKIEKRLEEAKKTLETLEDIKNNDTDDVESLRERLRELKLIPSDRKLSTRKKQPRRKPYRRFKSSCGWDILVGKSNADNDELSLKIANKDDYWFHAWQAAGSHVVLRLPDKKAVPEKQTLLEAASLAAYYSKARGSLKVAVAYTQAKYVRKPKKLPPGKVIVEREKQLMVVPADPKDFGTGDKA